MIRFLLKSVWYFLLMVLAVLVAAYITAVITAGGDISFINHQIMDAFHHEVLQEKVR